MNLRIATDVERDNPSQQRRAVMTSVGIHEHMLCRGKPSGTLLVEIIAVGADGPLAHVQRALGDWLGHECAVAWVNSYREAERGEAPCVYVRVEEA